jgi:hypothetical protein
MRGWLGALYRYYTTTDEWPEPRRDRSGRFIIPDDRFSRVVLTLGQVIAVVCCVLVVVSAAFTTVWFARVEAAFPEADSFFLWLGVVVGEAISFVFWLAVFFAFGRAKWVARLVECQQAVLARLLDRLDAEEPGGEPPRAAGTRPPGDELVLAIVQSREIVGGWVLLECDDGGWWVPELREGKPIEIRWADGRAIPATVAGEERHVRKRRPGRVAFTLRGPVRIADVAGATEVWMRLRRPGEPGAGAAATGG